MSDKFRTARRWAAVAVAIGVAVLAMNGAAGEDPGAAPPAPASASSARYALLLGEYPIAEAVRVEILGRPVEVRFLKGIDARSTASLTAKFHAAAALLNGHAAAFTANEALAIRQMREVNVTADPAVCLGQTSVHAMTMSTQYLGAVSTAWLGSVFAHEGQHTLDRGKFTGAERWKDEQMASDTQLAVGRIIGFSPAEIAFLTHWAGSANRATTQGHMEQCFTAADWH